jgi:hypothetical protein
MDDSKRPFLFLPGEEPGPYCLGLPDQPAMAGVLAAYRLKMGKLPLGNKVSALFPWLRNIVEAFSGPERRVITRNNYPYSFTNQSDKRVYVHEIRIRHDIAAEGPYQTDLWVRLDIPDRRVINEEWLPVAALNTEIDRFLYANLDTFCYELPAPYFLQRGNPFFLDVQYAATFLANTSSEDWIIEAGLHGWGQIDGEPISLLKPVRGWPQTAGVAGQYQTIVFDDEQDRTMRDAWITHLTIGSALTRNFDGLLQHSVNIRPVAPEGPNWHSQEFFRVDDIAEQVGAIQSNTLFDNYVIHRPIVPYVLNPGEGIRVELWNRSLQKGVTVSVTLRGTQEVL